MPEHSKCTLTSRSGARYRVQFDNDTDYQQTFQEILSPRRTRCYDKLTGQNGNTLWIDLTQIEGLEFEA